MKQSVQYLFRFCLLAYCLLSGDLKAQLTPGDSIFFQTHFNEYMYIDPILYPGNWYVYDSVVSMIDLENKLNLTFPYKSADFNNAYELIHPTSDIYYDTFLNSSFNLYYTLFGNAYKQYDPLVKLDFELNGKNSHAYTTFTPSVVNPDKEIAFLIIPGSNQNQTSEVMLGTGYHNTNCYVRNLLLLHGDVFIECKPLEDYRALHWNNSKLSSSDYNTPGPDYIYNYLDSIDQPYGTNYLIEALAMIKQLNKKYKKVVLVGCSMGGYSVFLSSMNAPVDACVVSSGYTKNADYDPAFMYELTQHFKDIPFQFPNTVVKDKLANSKTDYLFSWPDYDSYWYQLEHDSNYTQTFFSDLNNCSYFYNYEQHSFPPCYVIDTFLQKVVAKPKIFFTITDSTHADSMRTKIEFIGQGPFTFEVLKNGIHYKTYTAISNPVFETLTDSGMYTIRNIVNLNGLKGTCQDSILFSHSFPNEIAVVTDEHPNFHVQNPFNESIHVFTQSTLRSFQESEITVSSITGHQLIHTRMQKGQLHLNTISWNRGMYILDIISGRNHSVFKLCKL